MSLPLFLLLLGLVSFVPIFPCSEHGTVFAERMRISRLPGLMPAEAAALRAYADADWKCGICDRNRNVGAWLVVLSWLLH